MAEISPRTTWKLAKALRGKRFKPPRNDGVAVVTRVDRDGTRWVRMPGASMDTPVNGEMVANAAVGESVSYRVEDGRLSITGNASDPAMGVAAVNAAVGLVARAVEFVRGDVAKVADDNAITNKVASEARDVANATNQNFWTDTDGVHVTEVTQDEWKDSEGASYHSGPNMLINSVGQLLRNGLNNLVSITSSAIAFYDGLGNAASNIVARFGGDGARIGRDSQSHVNIDYHSMQMVDKEGETYFHVSDLRDSTGIAVVTDKFRGDGQTEFFQLSLYMSEANAATVTVNGDEVATVSIQYVDQVRLAEPPADGAEVLVTYPTNQSGAKAYTLGERGVLGTTGAQSFAFGFGSEASGQRSQAFGNTTASGPDSHSEGLGSIASGDISHAEGGTTTASGNCSHSEGSNAVASGDASHAEGTDTIASGQHSHAEGGPDGGYSGSFGPIASGHISHAEGADTIASGNKSHAEGYKTVASGYASHAEGTGTEASGMYAHAQNVQTRASGEAQTAIGRWNVEDTNDEFALIIGNGTNGLARSNALTVDWDGRIDGYMLGDVRDTGADGTQDTRYGTVAQSSPLALKAGEGKAVCSHTFAPGAYLITGHVYFGGNANGYRAAALHTAAGTIPNSAASTVQSVAPADGHQTHLQFPLIWCPTTTSTLYLNALSSVALNCQGQIRWVKLL